jgi:hypothetical protein
MKNIATSAELVLESGYICHLCPELRCVGWSGNPELKEISTARRIRSNRGLGDDLK